MLTELNFRIKISGPGIQPANELGFELSGSIQIMQLMDLPEMMLMQALAARVVVKYPTQYDGQSKFSIRHQ